MRTTIFDPKNIQVRLTTNKYKNIVCVHILDLRLPAGTEVETEETASYGPAPMYYADDCCMVSAAFIARIVRETLRHYYNQYFFDSRCHVYTPYSILTDEESKIYHKKHQIRLHSSYDPSKWKQHPHFLEFEYLYRHADRTIFHLMRDLKSGSFSLSTRIDRYKMPYDIYMDYDLGRSLHKNSAEVAMERLTYLRNPHFKESLHELDGMVGMDEYKEYIRQLLCANEMNKISSMSGKHHYNWEHGHFILTGKPSTGTKSAAEVLARVMHEYGIISRGKVVYRDRTSLLGENQEETKILMDDLFDHEADGNVLIINEPYTMLSDPNGCCALRLLADYTRNQASDYIVVLCGDSTEMRLLLSVCPSLKENCRHQCNVQPYPLDAR